tara:strand:+ start:1457 stop:2086 length:630 start_codon:yes stop_codon:yes gene_type:complete
MTEETVSEDTETETVEETTEQETGDEQAKESSDGDNPKGEVDDEGSDEEGEAEVFTAESFEMPEGIEVDAEKMGEFLELANNKEMSAKEKNQALVTLYASKQLEAAEAQTQQWETVRKEWKDEAKNHAEYGGKDYKKNQAVMLKTLNHFGNKELVDMGNHFGWMDNPHFQLFLHNAGKSLTEDQLASGRTVKSESIENRWYGQDGDKKK